MHEDNNFETYDEWSSDTDASKSFSHDRPKPKTDRPTERPTENPSQSSQSNPNDSTEQQQEE